MENLPPIEKSKASDEVAEQFQVGSRSVHDAKAADKMDTPKEKRAAVESKAGKQISI